MRKRIFYLLTGLACLTATVAHANWQYDGEYIGDGWYSDDGARFVISGRGGFAMGFAGIKNKMGALSSEYYINPEDDMVISSPYYYSCVENGGCENFVSAGVGHLSALSATKDFEGFSFAGGASIGWIMPNRPQWRIEGGWDHISESEYNAGPLFEGELALTGGSVDGVVVHVQSGSVQSKVSTDIVSVMAYYDFFDGIQKPVNKVIPYVGFGLGYADTKTVLNLSDPYGDLSEDADLRENFGELGEYGIVQFYRSETSSSNIAGLIAAGVSYGITDSTFFDFGARIAYIPKISWSLRNADDTRHREWFTAENIFYANVMMGLRFEF